MRTVTIQLAGNCNNFTICAVQFWLHTYGFTILVVPVSVFGISLCIQYDLSLLRVNAIVFPGVLAANPLSVLFQVRMLEHGGESGSALYSAACTEPCSRGNRRVDGEQKSRFVCLYHFRKLLSTPRATDSCPNRWNRRVWK